MDDELFNAILAMDVYNRGYNPAIKLTGSSIGLATIKYDSSMLGENLFGFRIDETTSFYAIAYSLPNDNVVISFRGTDNFRDTESGAAFDTALGQDSNQAKLAFQFYKLTAGTNSIDPRYTEISLTGHSLGGGLAGLVGAVYRRNAVIFDNMPFELAAWTTFIRSLGKPSTSPYDGLSQWTPLISTNIKAFHIGGEFLAALRLLQSTQSEKYDLGPNVSLGPLQRHSMALLVIRKFAKDEIAAVGNDWEKAAQYFLPQLFNERIAESINSSQSLNLSNLKGPGAGDLSEVMRGMIAYSAIDEGVRVFGDTAIRAMYDDASDLGKILANPDISRWINFQSISKLFVEYAGLLALHKIEKSTHSETLKGVLSLNSDQSTLTISLSNELWSLVGINSRSDLIGIHEILEDLYWELKPQRWADFYFGNIGSITYATSMNTDLEVSMEASGNEQPALFIAGDGNDAITSSERNDWVYGGDGNDTLFGSTGSDIFNGSGGYDTVDYKYFLGSITVRFDEVTKSTGGQDELFSIEHIYGTENADIFYMDQAGYSYHSNGGNDIFYYSDLPGLPGLDTIFIDPGTADNVTINDYGYGLNIAIWINDILISAAYQLEEGGLYYQDSLIFTPDNEGLTITAGASTVRINSSSGGKYGNITLYSWGVEHTLDPVEVVFEDFIGKIPQHASAYYRADGPWASINGKTSETYQYLEAGFDENGNPISILKEVEVPLTNWLRANNVDISNYAVSNIQNLEAYENVTVSAVTFGKFTRLLGGGTLSVVGGGTVSLRDIQNDLDSSFNLTAVGESGTTLIGNDRDNQILTASISGNDTLVAGNGNNNKLYAGEGNSSLIGGNGNDNIFMGTGVGIYRGGNGDDTFILTGAPAVGSIIDGESGNNKIINPNLDAHKVNWDISGAKISNIQILDARYVTLTAEQLAGFTTLSVFEIRTSGSGTFSLADKIIGNTDRPWIDLLAYGDDDVTLIGDDLDQQTISKIGGGNNTLIVGNGHGNHLEIRDGIGIATMLAGNGYSNSLNVVNFIGNISLTAGTGSNRLNIDRVEFGNASLVVGNGEANSLRATDINGATISMTAGNGNHNGLSVEGGKFGNATLTVGDGAYNHLSAFYIDGNISMTAGNGDNNVFQVFDNVTGNATLVAGNGKDNWFYVRDNNGDVSIQVGDGYNNWFLVRGNNGDVSITMNNGDNNDLDVRGNHTDVSMILGDGNRNSLYVDGGKNTVSIVLGNGDDNLIKIYNYGDTSISIGDGDNNKLYAYGGYQTLTGGGGRDIFNASDGVIETIKGGAGDDDIIFNSMIDENTVFDGGEGDDVLYSGLTDISRATIKNIETLSIWSAAKISKITLTEFQLNDFKKLINNTNSPVNLQVTNAGTYDLTGKTIIGLFNFIGSNGDDVLKGSVNSPMLIGGQGNDTYYVNSLKTIATEKISEGNDTVFTSVSYTLGANIENLSLTGNTAVNGTGGSGANIITGNDQKNTLAGLGGNDILDGCLGNDSMIGGLGNDTYYVGETGDIVAEALGQGLDQVFSSISFILGANIENLNLVGNTDINGTGNGLANSLTGNSGNNILNGGTGADSLRGGLGNDTYYVDAAGDTIIENNDEGTDTVFSAISHTLGETLENLALLGAGAISGTGNNSANTITGNSGNNILNGQGNNDILDGGKGNDTMYGGTGDDSYHVDAVGDVIKENLDEGTDTIISSITYTLGMNIENLTLAGTANINGTGNELTNTLIGNSGNNILNGGLGDDTLQGGLGDDTYYLEAPGDTAFESTSAGTDTVLSTFSYILGENFENLTLTGTDTQTATGNQLNNILTGNIADNALSGLSGNDTLDGGKGNDTLIGGPGDDIYFVDAIGDKVVEDADAGFDTVVSSVDYTMVAHVERVLFSGTLALSATGDERDNILVGNAGNNTLSGLSGNDILDGGKGIDALAGGTGDDTYYVDAIGDVITENADEGTDTAIGAVTFTLGANVEKLTLIGTTAISGTGNNLNNTLVGNSGNNTLSGLTGNDILDGGKGNDTMKGGVGDDTYYVDATGDIVTENLNEGTDTVFSTVTSTLKANVENLTLTGTAVINATGNDQNNILTGNDQNNILIGSKGDDVLIGGLGNDAYGVDSTGDTIIEQTDGGLDTVTSSVTYSLSANMENLTLAGTTAINGTANDLDNILIGNIGNNVLTGFDGNDILNGGKGNDTLIGGAGNDTYYVDSVADQVVENPDEGTDTVITTVTTTLTENVENLTLSGIAALNGTGNALNNILTGNGGSNILAGLAGDDIVDGGKGSDKMYGSTGNDTYFVDATGDLVVEKEDEGIDTVISSITATLGANLENLTLTGTAALNGTGNSQDNILIGNSGNNVLNGVIGNDTMLGGMGNDAYYVDASGDIITENVDEGTDTVFSSASYVLTANLESLSLIGTGAIDAQGNELNNILLGNTGDNTLKGFAGNDTLNGGLGNDTLLGGQGDDGYYVDSLGGTVVEAADEGTDTIFSSVSYSLGNNVENMTLSGTATLNATGNDLDNTLVGNTGGNILAGLGGNDILNGGKGNDTLIGGLGDDSYYVDAAGDKVVENADEGTDNVFTSAAYALVANIENLTLLGTTAIGGTGNDLNNILTGNTGNNILSGLAGNDSIDGGKGNDTMKGGLGDDTYYIDATGDIVTENLNEGTDTVISSATTTLKANIENLILIGTAAINGSGNDQNNTLTGNSGNNILNGSKGDDILIGGLGDDTYTVDAAGDIIKENNDEGADTVISTITSILGVNVENLTLAGITAINGTGNDLNNMLTGNSGNNTLIGLEGNDILNGGLGSDTMIGGLGDDSYQVETAHDVVTENDNEGTDTILARLSYSLGNNVENLILLGTAALTGTGNALANLLVGNAGSNVLSALAGNDTLDGGKGYDTMKGGLGDDTYYVDASGDTIVEYFGEGNDSVVSTVTHILKANVENLTLGGTLAINGIGNELNNIITGNSGNNIVTGLAGDDILDGKEGVDTLIGGIGSDTYYVDTPGDVVKENDHEGNDTIFSMISYFLQNNLENLILSGTAEIDGTGNSVANTLYGNSGNNTLIGLAGDDILDGKGGIDILIGGLGDDTYYVDGTDVLVTENADEGNDTVFAGFSYVLNENFENLTLRGSENIDGAGNGVTNSLIGNSGNNTLTGLAGNDIIDGKEGIDNMIGGEGDDNYYLDNVSDVVTEYANEGFDTVNCTITYSIGENVEGILLLGDAAIDANGNAQENTLTGNSGDNRLAGFAGNDILDGKAGNDIMLGGLGNDTYYVDDMGDVLTENAAEGTDLVMSAVTYTLVDNLENLSLTGMLMIEGTGNALDNILSGNSSANILTGLAGNDILDGGEGKDTMHGGLGDDIYFVDKEGDAVLENAGEGEDLIKSVVSYTLGANIEKLTLIGTDDIDGIGNSLNNIITGNTGDNALHGDGGDDILIGGLGDDTYIIDSASDIVTENADEGVDGVFGLVSYSLGNNAENLILIGSDNIDGNGNNLDNILMGNNSDNALSGGEGNDVLAGSEGFDHFIFESALDSDTNIDEIIDFAPSVDKIDLNLGIFSQLGVEGVLSMDLFAANATASALDENDYILYNTTSGALSYDIDGIGSTSAVQFATLSSKPSITASDFIVVSA